MIFKISRLAVMLAVILITSFISCNKGAQTAADTAPQPVMPEPGVPGVVYAVGAKGAGSMMGATLWKDGVATWTTSRVSSATGIAVKDTDIYIAGSEYDLQRACYWKNGKFTSLNYGIFATDASGIVLSGSDVYVSGFAHRHGVGSDAIYWKNGIPTLLPTPGNVTALAYDIAVIGGDVYVCGQYNAETVAKACYWKNNVFYPLPGGEATYASGASSIALNNNDVYIGGYVTENSATGTFMSATVWKNGVANKLTKPDGNKNSSVVGLTFANGQLYASGTAVYGTEYRAVYWLGADIKKLDAPIGCWSTAIAVYGSEVYVGGKLEPLGSPNTQAVFWKGQTQVFTAAPITYISDIKVVPKR